MLVMLSSAKLKKIWTKYKSWGKSPQLFILNTIIKINIDLINV